MQIQTVFQHCRSVLWQATRRPMHCGRPGRRVRGKRLAADTWHRGGTQPERPWYALWQIVIFNELTIYQPVL